MEYLTAIFVWDSENSDYRVPILSDEVVDICSKDWLSNNGYFQIFSHFWAWQFSFKDFGKGGLSSTAAG